MSRVELIGEASGCVWEQSRRALKLVAEATKIDEAEFPKLRLAQRVKRDEGEQEIWEVGRLWRDNGEAVISVAEEDATEYWENGVLPEVGAVFAVAHLGVLWAMEKQGVRGLTRERGRERRKAARMALKIVKSMYYQEKRRMKYPTWWENVADGVEGWWENVVETVLTLR